MAISSLIYCSRVSGAAANAVPDILSAARRNNARLGVTGALLFDSGAFLQLLEGGGDAVTEVFLRISTDPRHEEVRLLGFRDMPCRRCPDWSMQHVPIGRAAPGRILRFMPGHGFQPDTLGTEGAEALFDAVAEEAARDAA
jgi:hypothetical protein